MDDQTPMDDFLAMSREYAQALEALEAIETQAPTIIALGGAGELRNYLDQFLAMARATRERAVERDLPEIAGWFDELIARAGSVEVSST